MVTISGFIFNIYSMWSFYKWSIDLRAINHSRAVKWGVIRGELQN